MDSNIVQMIHEILESARGKNLKAANEATTRLRVINRVLGLLGWEPDDISPEESCSEDGTTTFADYIMRTANTALVVEAKKHGATFDIGGSSRRVSLNSKVFDGDAGAAIRQARDYCRRKSIPFAVVTNGDQWIVFPAVRVDQVEFEKSAAIVFHSLEEALGSEFQYFQSLLSRDGAIDGTLEIELLGQNIDQFEERRLKTRLPRTAPKPPNPIFPLIEPHVNEAFSDVVNEQNEAFLQLCYVQTADRRKFDRRIQMHLKKREALFATRPHRPLRPKERDVLKDAIENARLRVRPLAILLLGSVGTGKTTFLAHTRKVSSKDFFAARPDKDYPHWIYVDYRAASESDAPIDYIYDRAFEYLTNDEFFGTYERAIRSAYQPEINGLKKGPLALVAKNEERFEEQISSLIYADYQSKRPYVDKLLSYAAKRQPIFLVVDNVDQIENEEVQSRVFADSIALASRLGLGLVLAMRESTFIKHRTSPVFNAFDYEPIHIEPPEVAAVLSRRFLYLKHMLMGKSGTFTALNGARVDVESLDIFVDLVQQSVLGTEVGLRIDVLANRDIRLALRMTREFLERGYTDPARALDFKNSDRNYVMPRHEAFRAILLGNQLIYSEAQSTIGNPFDSRLGKSAVQFLRLFVLTALVRSASDARFELMDGVTIREVCRKVGFGDAHIQQVLSDLCNLRFAHTMSHGAADWLAGYAPTRLGGFMIRSLISDFTFIENVMMDTFVPDTDVWGQLKQLTDAIDNERDKYSKTVLRVKRVRVFWRDMAKRFASLSGEANRRGLAIEWRSDPFAEAKHDLSRELMRVLRSSKRLYKK